MNGRRCRVRCVSEGVSRMLRRAVNLISMLLLGLMLPAMAQPNVVLTSRVTIVERPNEAGPVHKAVEDLASDLEKVLGTRAEIVTSTKAAGANVIEIAPPAGGPAESFSVATKNGHVVLSGADMRGQIYAIYQFSQEYLGVDPMYYWTDKEPARKTSVTLPAGLNRTYPSPVFKYRGFFVNDEDQLTGWAPGEQADHTGIRLAVMDKIYETILRLKGNMVAPSTWPFPDDPQIKLVGERGLILNQHHATPVGMNAARWPQNVPYSFTEHPEILQRAWRNAIHAYDPKQEILWTVGLRGLSDRSYASMGGSVRSDEAQGALITKAIQEQMRLVREVQPNAHFITNLWMEGVRLMKEGYLRIPPEVTAVWADTGYGLVKDQGDVAKGQGMYYHIAMMNDHANQLTEMVPVDRIQSEFGRYIKAGATEFMLVNTSDIRAVAMTAKAVMDTAWGGVPASSSAHGFYMDWATREFGAAAAPDVARVYEEYYHAIAHRMDGNEYGDNAYHTITRRLLTYTMVHPPYYGFPGQQPKWSPVPIENAGPDGMQQAKSRVDSILTRDQVACAAAMPKWDKAWQDALAAEPLVPNDRKSYYRYGVLTMTAINRNSNHILVLLSRSVSDLQNGNRDKARQEALATLADFDEIKRFQAQSEYGKWSHWWRGDWLVNINATRAMVDAYIRWLDDPNMTVPYPVFVNSWEGYYHILHYQGNRSIDVH